MKKSIIISALLAFVVNSPLAFSAEPLSLPAGAGMPVPVDMAVATGGIMGEDFKAGVVTPWDNAMGAFAEHTLVATVILVTTAGIIANAAATGTSGT